MELHFSHASKALATRAVPLDAMRLILSGSQPELELLFLRRWERMKKRGDMDNLPGRLVNRKPVEMKPSTTVWNPPAKAKVRSTNAIVHDHPWLTATQRGCRTSVTLGKPVEMKNRVAEQREGRRAMWLVRQAKKAAK